jgi:CheY-like chemotaxis protein/two-component sensor histidine kinase
MDSPNTQFLANVNYEVRTPVQTIIGMLELLQDTELSREQEEYVRQIQFSAEALLSLVNGLLEISKIESNRVTLEYSSFDLGEIVEQTAEMIALEVHKKGLELTVDIAPDADITVQGDPKKIHQVLLSLIKNGVKFTSSGSITIKVRLCDFRKKEGIKISVADTGIGIPEDIRKNLFADFYQGDASNTRHHSGVGLGLTISKKLVDLMKGAIDMEPNKGGGSRFTFTIPIERPLKGRSGSLMRAVPVPPELTNTGILVIDDNYESRSALVSCLESAGYTRVRAAPSGETALDLMRSAAAKKSPFSLCFIDMVMPSMDGWRLAAEINKDKTINGANLILMIPYGMVKRDAKMLLLNWFNAYIYKPIKRVELMKAIIVAQNGPGLDLEAYTGTGKAEKPPAVTAPLPAFALSGLRPAEHPIRFQLPPDGPRPLILIVEDYLVNQKLFGLIMDKLGCPSVSAEDGFEALERVEAQTPALIFMDLQMPRMDGFEATAELRRRGYKGPIIAVTAGTLDGEEEKCAQSGFNDILFKPFKRAAIEGMLAKWIGNGGTAGNAGAGSAAAGPDSEILNGPELLDTFMDNRESVDSLLARFIERTITDLETVARKEAEGDWEGGRRIAHTIKGSARTLTGKELGNAAALLEEAFFSKDRARIAEVLPLVKEGFAHFKEAADVFVKEGGAS